MKLLHTFILVFCLLGIANAQNVEVVDLTKTVGKGKYVKLLTVENSTVIVREKAIKGPGGFEYIIDLVTEDNDVKQFELFQVHQNKDLQYVNAISHGGKAVLIYKKVDNKAKKVTYYAYRFDPINEEFLKEKKLFEKDINKPQLINYFYQKEYFVHSSSSGDFLGMIYVNTNDFNDNFVFHVLTFDKEFNETLKSKHVYQKNSNTDAIFDFKISNDGTYAVLWEGMPSVSYLDRKSYNNRLNHPKHYYSVTIFSPSGEELMNKAFDEKYHLNFSIAFLNNTQLIASRTVGLSSCLDCIEKVKTVLMDTESGDIEMLIDTDFNKMALAEKVANKESLNKKGGFMINMLDIVIHNSTSFSVVAQVSVSESSGQVVYYLYGDIYTATYSDGQVDTHILPRPFLSKRTEFVSMNDQLTALIFIPDGSRKEVDLVLLFIEDKISGVKLLSREDSKKINSGPVLKNYGKASESLSNGGIVYYFEKSAQEAFVVKVTK